MDSNRTVCVRFAPSPTGALHVGGARTALFNFLFARHTGGQFLLRIEDTDVSRSQEELTEQILRSLRWLGLSWDGEPFHQSTRKERHIEICRDLLEKGSAYPCFCGAETLQEKREKSIKETGEYKYDRMCRAIPLEESHGRIRNGEARTLRFKVPEGETTFEDGVRGTVSVDHTQIDDFILLRTDGTPVYQVAVVVDDHDMGITHVIRGDDHLSNTPKQILIYQAMEWDLPSFAHVPMILGQDKKRLSKRHGATSVEEYQDAGYLPEALVNFLALLSWSPGDDREIMTMNEMIDAFSLNRISKNPAVFEETKLVWMNAQYIMGKSEAELLKVLMPFIVEADLADEAFIQEKKDYLLSCIRLMRERMKTLKDFVENGCYYFMDPPKYDENAVQKIWKKEGILNRLKTFVEELERCSDWSIQALESVIEGMAERLELGLGKILQPARLAVTGSAASPGMFELMEVLGKESTLRRLKKAIAYIEWMDKEKA
ncbi:MAG: glutamate--tRNA ligase [bacterium]